MDVVLAFLIVGSKFTKNIVLTTIFSCIFSKLSQFIIYWYGCMLVASKDSTKHFPLELLALGNRARI